MMIFLVVLHKGRVEQIVWSNPSRPGRMPAKMCGRAVCQGRLEGVREMLEGNATTS